MRRIRGSRLSTADLAGSLLLADHSTHPSPPRAGSGYRGGMAKEIRIEVDDETFEELRRRAADDHEEPDQYASRRLTADLARTRFLEGARAFVEEHGQAFTDRFGTTPSSHAA